MAWTIIATAILLMDSIGAGNFREQAKREQSTYQAAAERLVGRARHPRRRGARRAGALQLRARADFDDAVANLLAIRDAPPRARDRDRRDPEPRCATRCKTRETARGRIAALEEELRRRAGGALPAAGEDDGTIDMLSDALARTAAERDQVVADAQDALIQAAEMDRRNWR